MRRLLCARCGLLIAVRVRYGRDEHGGWTAYVTVDEDHYCRPHLARFFNPDSQHEAPYGR